MKKHILKRIFLIFVSIIGLILLLILLIPLFISPDPIEGLSQIKDVKTKDSRFISIPFEGTDGIEFHYIDKGEQSNEKPVFILLHGSMYNSYTWNEVIDFFGEKGRVIAYDQIPYGLSEKLVEGDWSQSNPYTADAAIAQLLMILENLNLKKVYLVGSSYGGTLAIKTAIEYPGIIEGLILVDPAIFVNESMPAWIVNSRQMKNIGPLIARSMGSGTTFYEQCYKDPDIFLREREEITTISTKIENWDFALWEYLRAWGVARNDFENFIPEIEAATLLISGTDDNIVPPEDSEKLNTMIPNSTLVMIPETGHLPHEESPEKFIEAVNAWIESKDK